MNDKEQDADVARSECHSTAQATTQPVFELSGNVLPEYSSPAAASQTICPYQSTKQIKCLFKNKLEYLIV